MFEILKAIIVDGENLAREPEIYPGWINDYYVKVVAAYGDELNDAILEALSIGDYDIGITGLKALLEKKEHEINVGASNPSGINVINNVSQVSNQEANAVAYSYMDFDSMVNQVSNIQDSKLDDETRQILIDKLQRLEDSKGQGKAKVKQAAKAVGDFLFDKALEAIPTVMPYVVQVVKQGIIGQ